MANPSARAVALRELLVDAMAKAAEPLSTNALRQVPPAALLPWRAGPGVYVQLRALERMGICRRVRRTDVERGLDPKNAYWRYTHDDTLADVIAELDRADIDG